MLTATHYTFGPFQLYPSEHRLVRGDKTIPLSPKAFDLLLTLVSHHGRLLTRESLMQTVWPDSFVEETNLTVNISLLRKTLGEMDDGRPWIATAPKLGYRFDGVVTLHDEVSSAPPEIARPKTPDPPSMDSPPGSQGRAWLFSGLLAAVVLIVGFAVFATVRHHSSVSSMSSVGSLHAATPNSAVNALCVQGRSYLSKRSVEATQKGIDLFEQAIQVDPNYAPGYAGLADAYILAGSYGNSFLAPGVAMPKAKAAIEKALALDDSSADAHTSLAYIKLVNDWDWTGAEREFKRAIELNPNSVNAHHWYSHELMALGRVDESHRESEIALGLEPTNVVINEHMAWHHLMNREYDRAIAQAVKAVQLDPDFVQAHRVLGLAYLYTNRQKEASDQFEKGVALSRGDPVSRAYLARCYAAGHRQPEARKILTSLEAEAVERYISSAEIAPIYIALGDHDSAMRAINKAIDERAASLIYLNVDRAYDPLRSDPRFQADLKRINLTPKADETLTR